MIITCTKCLFQFYHKLPHINPVDNKICSFEFNEIMKIYLLMCKKTTQLKIGYTERIIDKRMQELKRYYRDLNFEFINAIYASKADETFIKRKFNEFLIINEYELFHYSPNIINYFSNHPNKLT